jgi:hypothetical protein
MPQEKRKSDISLDAEMRALTPREQHIADLAEQNKLVVPQRYTITSKNPKARRVVHDFNGNAVTIKPGETKQGVLLLPDVAEYLGKGDLTLSAGS